MSICCVGRTAATQICTVPNQCITHQFKVCSWEKTGYIATHPVVHSTTGLDAIKKKSNTEKTTVNDPAIANYSNTDTSLLATLQRFII